MKQFLIMAIAILSFSLVTHAQPLPAEAGPNDYFSSIKYEFGKIPLGKPVATKFTFTNKSNRPLVITSVNTACSCITTFYPKTNIGPGQTATITVGYNAAVVRQFSEQVNVAFASVTGSTVTNFKLPATLVITGEVVK